MKNNQPLTDDSLISKLNYLNLPFIRDNYIQLANNAAQKNAAHLDYLAWLIDGEDALKQDRATARRIKLARFPVIKTLDQFQWSWPKSINELLVKDAFRLQFIKDKANLIFLGTVGLGKTHLATALGHAACLKGFSVLFSTAIDAINSLCSAMAANRLKQELSRFANPDLLILDELGYLPIDKKGADLLFQIISRRYDTGSIIFTSNRAFKNWPEIFNNDSTLTSAILDRILHHASTIQISGKSFRMKDQIEL
jgi:DNA replication protein DnaC